MEGETARYSGSLLGSLLLRSPRWDSVWQGGSGMRKRRRGRRRRPGAGEAKTDMAGVCVVPTRSVRKG